jgi:hypothetical protein
VAVPNEWGSISSIVPFFGYHASIDTAFVQFHQVCNIRCLMCHCRSKEYQEYELMRAALEQYRQAKSQLLDKRTADCSGENLKADQIITQLFARAKRLLTTEDIIAKAKRRYDLGNPPGKDGSFGDAVIWECLLEEVTQGEDLLFISADSDYCAKIDRNRFDPFLQKEWLSEKAGRVIFFKQLSTFFHERFPDIRLATELEKELLIRDLTNSPSFRSTRHTLRQLVRFSDFTDDQLNDIVLATVSNNQIYWIVKDSDITRYLRALVAGNESRVKPEKLRRFQELLDGEPAEEEDVVVL